MKAPGTSEESEEPSSNDIRLQVDLRLRLDEVADAEAEYIRSTRRGAPSRKELCRLACRIYDARRARERMMDPKFFGEPAWDMLLALYCLPARGERLTVTALSLAANTKSTTGIRWQSILIEQGLIELGPKDLDERLKLVRLTDKGRQLLENYLTRLFYVDTPTPPFPEKAGR